MILGGGRGRGRGYGEADSVGRACEGVGSHLSASVGVAGQLGGPREVARRLGRPRGHWGHVTLEQELMNER